MVCADDGKNKSDKPNALPGKQVDGKKTTVVKGEKPKASPGWVVIEQEWWNPFLYDFSTSLHNARERYRAKEEKSASVEIDKAISWLSYAQSHAEKTTAEDLAIARADLSDFSARLKSGKPVLARQLSERCPKYTGTKRSRVRCLKRHLLILTLADGFREKRGALVNYHCFTHVYQRETHEFRQELRRRDLRLPRPG